MLLEVAHTALQRIALGEARTIRGAKTIAARALLEFPAPALR
jgi:hypothetical protein